MQAVTNMGNVGMGGTKIIHLSKQDVGLERERERER